MYQFTLMNSIVCINLEYPATSERQYSLPSSFKPLVYWTFQGTYFLGRILCIKKRQFYKIFVPVSSSVNHRSGFLRAWLFSSSLWWLCFSGSQEEVHLVPGEARLFAWADPTGTRKLAWTYAANTGEHSLLKVSFDVNEHCNELPGDKGSRQASFTQSSLSLLN